MFEVNPSCGAIALSICIIWHILKNINIFLESQMLALFYVAMYPEEAAGGRFCRCDIAREGVNMKRYLSSSVQPHNAYAVENTTEQVKCNRIAVAAKAALEWNCYIVKKEPEGQSYVKNAAESNAWVADVHVPIHTNAGGNNKGTLGLCFEK